MASVGRKKFRIDIVLLSINIVNTTVSITTEGLIWIWLVGCKLFRFCFFWTTLEWMLIKTVPLAHLMKVSSSTCLTVQCRFLSCRSTLDVWNALRSERIYTVFLITFVNVLEPVSFVHDSVTSVWKLRVEILWSEQTLSPWLKFDFYTIKLRVIPSSEHSLLLMRITVLPFHMRPEFLSFSNWIIIWVSVFNLNFYIVSNQGISMQIIVFGNII